MEKPRLTNFHLLVVRYIGATDTKPSKVKIISERFKQSVTVDYNRDCRDSSDVARHWLESNGFEIVGQCEGKTCDYLISSTFEPLK